MNLTPLVAAIPIGDILEFIFILVVVGGGILVKWLSNMNPQKPPMGAGRPKPPPQPAPRDALSNEIDDFLRRAAQRRQQTQPARPPRRQPVAARSKPVEQPAPAEVVARPVGGGLDKHLQQFTEEKKQFEQRAARLGDEVAQADDKIEAHLKDKFTHRLGSLERQSGVTAAQPMDYTGVQTAPMPVAAAGFAAMLTTADSLRQAVVLTEILNRPTGRWE
jgi:hypothetical protein